MKLNSKTSFTTHIFFIHLFKTDANVNWLFTGHEFPTNNEPTSSLIRFIYYAQKYGRKSVTRKSVGILPDKPVIELLGNFNLNCNCVLLVEIKPWGYPTMNIGNELVVE